MSGSIRRKSLSRLVIVPSGARQVLPAELPQAARAGLVMCRWHGT